MKSFLETFNLKSSHILVKYMYNNILVIGGVMTRVSFRLARSLVMAMWMC